VRRLLALVLCAPSAAGADGPVVLAVGADGGVALQSDQYVLGPRVAARAAAFPYAQLEVVALAGLGPDHFHARSSLRLRPRLEIQGVHASLIAGASLHRYIARGPFATFCDKADLDCSDTVFGWELGLGLGYRWAGVDLVVATGEVPLYTLTGGVTFTL
jgi:hypothetical protein